MLRRRIVAALAVLVAAARVAAAAEPSPYAPYRFLIGEWDVAPESGGPSLGVTRFRWGPNESYIWMSSSFFAGGAEKPHFEGLLVWNGVSRKLDMLVCMDLDRGLVQEKGAVAIEGDGTVVREITASYGEGVRPIGRPAAGREGATARFRQTYRPLGADRVATAALREADGRWVATFPGSDRLVMTRRGRS